MVAKSRAKLSVINTVYGVGGAGFSYLILNMASLVAGDLYTLANS